MAENQESLSELQLYPPGKVIQILEKLGVRDVRPEDICPEEKLPILYKMFPELLGDREEMDITMGGRCQVWRDNPRWWDRFLKQNRTPIPV